MHENAGNNLPNKGEYLNSLKREAKNPENDNAPS